MQVGTWVRSQEALRIMHASIEVLEGLAEPAVRDAFLFQAHAFAREVVAQHAE